MANNNGVVDSPYIEYDKEALANGTLILKQKYTIFFMLLAVLLIALIIGINTLIVKTNGLKENLAGIENGIDRTKIKSEKIKQLTSNSNKNLIIQSQALLENLFFTDERNYEIVDRLKVFFESDEIKSQLGTFDLSDVAISKGRPVNGNDTIKKIKISITGKYQIFTGLENMITVLNKMKPIIIVNSIKFGEEGSIKLEGYTYLFKKDLFVYKYGEHYKNMNKLLQMVEEYKKNKEIFERLLQNNKLELKTTFGIDRIYNCEQFEKIYNILKIEKTDHLDIVECKNLENLIEGQRIEIDKSFNKYFNK